MNSQTLFELMSEIDFDLIERAEAPVPMRKKPIFRVAMAAAVIAILLSVSTLTLTVAGVAVSVQAVQYVEQNYPAYDGTVLHFAQIFLTEDENAISSLLDDDTKRALGGWIAALRENWGGVEEETLGEADSEQPEDETEPPEEQTDAPVEDTTDGGGRDTEPITHTETEPEITDEEPEDGWSEGLAYTEQTQNGKTVYVVSGIGTCTDTELHIPPTHQGCRVVAIGERAFEAQKSITAVALPSTVKEICATAFRDCDNLQSVTLNQGLECIDAWAFADTPALQIIRFPDTLVEIGESAFNTSGLLEIVLPDSVITVGDNAFAYCNKLESATLSKGMQSISGGMFSNADALQSVVITEGIATVGRNAFQGCSSLQYIALPDSVKQIDYAAFSMCGMQNGLTIVLPQGLTTVDTSAFSQSGILEIVIPQGLKHLPEFMFFKCKKLESVTLYASIESIGREAFTDCDALRRIEFVGSAEDWESVEMPDDVREQLTPLVVYVSE